MGSCYQSEQTTLTKDLASEINRHTEEIEQAKVEECDGVRWRIKGIRQNVLRRDVKEEKQERGWGTNSKRK